MYLNLPTAYTFIRLIFRPESAQRTSIGVKEGDIILVGTDGLFDNLSDEMILHHVSQIKVIIILI